MGFTPTFYAGRPKLSEVTIDSDLNMGGRNILRVGRIDSPYRPETWPTEELDWGDITPIMRVYEVTEDTPGVVNGKLRLPRQQYTKVAEFTTPDTPGTHIWKFDIYASISSTQTLDVITQTATGDVIHTNSIVTDGFPQRVVRYVEIPPNTDVEIVMYPRIDAFAEILVGTFIESYMASWPKTFDLTGKWLALGIDMHGLDATIKIQGVEIPYSDYAKYFPLAPTELTIPGGWDASQIRPIVEVYV